MCEYRASSKEIIDKPDCGRSVAADSYRFMETVNVYFGGIQAVRRFVAAETKKRHSPSPMRILDIGAGTCDIPLAVSRWASAHGIPLHVTCLELSDHACDIARVRLARAGDRAVQLLKQDVFAHQPAEAYDCAVASMCFHHFSNEQILLLVQQLAGFVRSSLLINDLRRSSLAVWATKLLLAFTGTSASVRHDALLSIRRGFRVDELRFLIEQLPDVTFSAEYARWFRIAAVVQFQSGDTA